MKFVLLVIILLFLGWMAWLHSDGMAGWWGSVHRSAEEINASSSYAQALRSIASELLAPLDAGRSTDGAHRVALVLQKVESDFADGRLTVAQVQALEQLGRRLQSIEAERQRYQQGYQRIQERPMDSLQPHGNAQPTRAFLLEHHQRQWEAYAERQWPHVRHGVRELTHP